MYWSFICRAHILSLFFFFFNDTATTEIYTLSLHDALPILSPPHKSLPPPSRSTTRHHRSLPAPARWSEIGRSTRLNSSHSQISYAVFCLKKKKTNTTDTLTPTPVTNATATSNT